MRLDGEEMKSITLKTFILPPLSVSPSALQVTLSETDLASLEVKNKNILLLWELLDCNYETFPCRALKNIQINHQQNALSVSGYFHSSLVNEPSRKAPQLVSRYRKINSKQPILFIRL